MSTMTGKDSGPVLAPPEDGAAFIEWVRPYLAAMARLATRLADGSDRDGIVQEALVRAWMKRHQYDGSRGAASAWLLAITADQARKAARRLRSVAEVEDNDTPEARLDVVARVDVDQALTALSARQRLAVDCCYFADLSIADTAAGVRSGPVASRSQVDDDGGVLVAPRAQRCSNPPVTLMSSSTRFAAAWLERHDTS